MTDDKRRLLASLGYCDIASGWMGLLIDSGIGTVPENFRELFEKAKRDKFSFEESGEDWSFAKNLYVNHPYLLLPASVTVHEETHFYQIIATPFGRFLSDMERVFTLDLSRWFKGAAVSGFVEKISFPLSTWIGKNGDSDSKDEALHKAMLALIHAQGTQLRKLFLESGSFQEEVSAPETIEIACELWTWFLQALDRAEDAVDTPEDMSIKQRTHPSAIRTNLPPNSPVCPQLEEGNLGGRDILEAVALELQLNYLSAGNIDRRVVEFLRLINPTFANSSYMRVRRHLANRFSNLEWKRRRSLLLILADLALSGPFYSNGSPGKKSEVLWEDLHPGYRFVRSLDAFEALSIEVTGNPCADYARVVETVCSHLGWETPSMIAAAFIESVKNPSSFSQSDPILHLRERAARARMERPDFFASWEDELNVNEEFQLKIPFLVEKSELRIGNLESRNINIVLHSCLQSAAADIYAAERIKPVFSIPLGLAESIYNAITAIFLGKSLSPTERQEFFGIKFTSSEEDTDDAEEVSATTAGGLQLPQELRSYVSFMNDVDGVRAQRWFTEQPAIVARILELREMREEGGFTIEKSELFELLAANWLFLNSEFYELLEDIGLDMIIPDVRSMAGFLDAVRGAFDQLSLLAKKLFVRICENFDGETFDDFKVVLVFSGAHDEAAFQELLKSQAVVRVGLYKAEDAPIMITEFRVNDNFRKPVFLMELQNLET
ncbi:MAG TPA: hypothetical protein VG796_04245 [Verrucomicrobiales bacterium]|nr:hypothetical protein [Verrucomicrobiales bacterium]